MATLAAVGDASPTAGDAIAATILMVDDDPPLRMLVERVLTLFGYRSLVAAEGEEALRIARANPDIALVMLDVMMPGISGQQLAGGLKILLPEAAILLCSGHSAKAIALMGIDIPGAEFMQKPCHPLELKQRLSVMLSAR